MNLRTLMQTLTRDRDEPETRRSARRVDVSAAQQLLPPDATIGRLRRFSLNHGSRPVEGLVGEHRSRRKGAAPEFSDFSPYTPGDDMRRIDWNAYARFESLYVRESEVTTELNVHLLFDTSASMDWTGHRDRDTKLQMARRIGALLAWIALARSDRISITPVTDVLGETFGPVQGRGMVVPASSALAAMRAGGEARLCKAVEAYILGRPRAGLLIVVSDLIGVSNEAFDHTLALLANGRWRASVVQVADPLEVDPAGLAEAHEVLEIEDPETGMRQRINMHDDTILRYVRARDAWLADLQATANRRAVPLVRITSGMRLDPEVLLVLERAGVITS